MGLARGIDYFPTFTMKGSFTIVESFNERTAKASVAEDVFQPKCGCDWFLTHEIQLTVGSSKPVVIWSHEIDAVISVLQKAKDLAEKRVMEFYLNDEAASLSTPTP